MIDSPLCTFCKTEIESPEHLFFFCDITKKFWQMFSSWLSEQNIVIPSITIEKIIFGLFDITEDYIILNHLILLAKFYIYKCKLNITYPSLKVFLAKIKATYQIEINSQHITKKWSKVLPCLT